MRTVLIGLIGLTLMAQGACSDKEMPFCAGAIVIALCGIRSSIEEKK